MWFTKVLSKQTSAQVGCVQPWGLRQRCSVTAARVIHDSSTHALSPRPTSSPRTASYRPAYHFSVSECPPSSEPGALPEPLYDFCSFIQGLLVEEVCLPMCVYVHTHTCVCPEKKVLLCCCYDVRAESHSTLQSFPSSDAAISRLLIKRH